MSSLLETTSLPEVCELVTDGTHDSPKLQSYGVPFIKGKHISSEKIDFENCDYIKEEDHQRCVKRVKPQFNDVLFSNIGSIGDAARVVTETEFSIKNVALFRPNPAKIDPLYFYYLVISPYFRGRFLNVRSGSAQPFISLESFRSLKFKCLRDKKAQENAGTILSAYDDLIENNRRRIQLLEKAARLLYKEWFVHLRFPGHEHTQIIDGVPEGWKKGVVSDFYDTASGGTPSRKTPEFYGGTIRWVKTQELEDGFLFDTEEHITENAIKKSAAKLFPANTVLIAMYGATIGQVGVIVESSTCNQACCAVMPKAEGTSYEHAFLFFLNNKEGLRNLGQGTAQKNISQQVIRAYEMVLPDKLVLNMFRINAGPFLRQIRTLQSMNQKLAKARDLLLPKLMNGEVAV